jgi:transposase
MKRFVEGEDRRLWGLRAWAAGRPAYHPATMLKIYVYGYLPNRFEPEA